MTLKQSLIWTQIALFVFLILLIHILAFALWLGAAVVLSPIMIPYVILRSQKKRREAGL